MKKAIKKFFKDIIGIDNQGRPWLNIRDKVITTTILNEDKKRFCPPHRIPHTLPFIGKEIKDEECHIHTTAWRDSHHCPYCKIINCKNHKAMLKARKKFKIRNWIFTDKKRNRKRIKELKFYP
jgi:hypothetical protein